ncbi:MAG TPA: DNA mismatch repair endonuclease MutL, partial [Lachnospiraceae bacterium]|nr:DNA mismatch repair endonuclease MutL [Lachnospiraceae bacterium]
MPQIQLLDQNTINQIAAGEVIERPAAVVKELVENAIDAKSNAITVEIKEGGTSFIRITDNGTGISKEDIKVAFLRHSTSKIRSALDLLSVSSLGFRGEALSSIASVAEVELVTKTAGELTGTRYVIEGGKEKCNEEIGCPEGTTFIVRNLFYNTPARRKFLKSPMSEASYIGDLIERMAVSHPEIAFKFINGNQIKIQTSGNGNLKDIIYHIYGRDIASNVVELKDEGENLTIHGYVGKPIISRGNRNYENYYINGRYVKSSIISKAIEEAYKPYTMSHRYPFTAIHLLIQGEFIDVNVHPTKMEIRFRNNEEVYSSVYHTIKNALAGKELIPNIALVEEKEKSSRLEASPEPFERNRINAMRSDTKIDMLKQPMGGEKKESSKTESKYDPKLVAMLDSMIEKNRVAGNDTKTISNGTENSGSKGTFTGENRQTTMIDDDKRECSTKVDSIDSIKLQSNLDNNHTNRYNAVSTDVSKNDSTKVVITKQYDSIIESTEIGKLEHIIKRPQEAIQNEILNSKTITEVSLVKEDVIYDGDTITTEPVYQVENSVQITLFEEKLISEESRKKHRIIGQLFATYWIVEFQDKMFLIDQHAAHEKVLYERLMLSYRENDFSSQMLLPPIILTLSMREEEILKKYSTHLERIGFEIEHFGGKEYSVRAVPNNLLGIAEKDYLIELIDSLVDEVPSDVIESILEKAASMSCKAAV